MKVLFTADIHIKLGQKNVPIEWARKRYKELFRQLGDISSKCDLTIIGGDIFDKVPSMEELELYFKLIAHIWNKGIIYSGNHEAIRKDTTFLSSLKSVTELLTDSRLTIVDDYHSENGIDFIPYNKLKEWAANPDNIFVAYSRILATHVRGEIPPHVKPEVDLSLFDKWELVLAGDLHSYENSQRNILYPGSPVTTSFHRGRVDTGVLIVDTDTLRHEFVKLELPQLIRKTIKAGEPMPAGDYDHVVYEIEGNLSELAGVAGSELIDKKIVRRSTDAALILDPGMTIRQEVEEYLRYILALEGADLDKVLQELSHYVTE